jgi:secondary thiamine-phosphate synthase enzyme
MIIRSHTIRRDTAGDDHILDLTSEIQALVRESGILTGQLTAMVTGSTGALSTLEYEPGLVEHDIAAALEKIAPRDGRYEHEETWHDDNGHSHVRATLVGPALSLPIVGGTIPLGTWQQVVLLDFDTRARSRSVAVTLLGE